LPEKNQKTRLVSQIRLIQIRVAEGKQMQDANSFQQSKGGDPMSHGSAGRSVIRSAGHYR
jgi:hypothetical protein